MLVIGRWGAANAPQQLTCFRSGCACVSLLPRQAPRPYEKFEASHMIDRFVEAKKAARPKCQVLKPQQMEELVCAATADAAAPDPVRASGGRARPPRAVRVKQLDEAPALPSFVQRRTPADPCSDPLPDAVPPGPAHTSEAAPEIGRASCRERVSDPV